MTMNKDVLWNLWNWQNSFVTIACVAFSVVFLFVLSFQPIGCHIADFFSLLVFCLFAWTFLISSTFDYFGHYNFRLVIYFLLFWMYKAPLCECILKQAYFKVPKCFQILSASLIFACKCFFTYKLDFWAQVAFFHTWVILLFSFTKLYWAGQSRVNIG